VAGPLHRNQSPLQGNHVPHRYTFANAVDRAAFTNETSGNAYNTLALMTAADVGALALQVDNASLWALTGVGTPGVGPVTWSELTSTGLAAYTTVQEGGTPLTQRSALNFVDGLVATDDGGGGRTNVNVVYGATGSVAANTPGAVGTAGVSTSLAPIDHQHAMAAFGSTGGTFAEGNDARLSDARTPTAHAASHQPGGGDAMAVDAIAATGSLRTLGTSATSAAAGNDARLSDDRTASGLRTASTVVVVSAATAPTAGQTLVASSTTLAAWITPAYPVLVFGGETVTATTTTRYLPPGYAGGTDVPINPVALRVPRAGVLRQLYLRHNQTAGNGNSIVYTVRVNGVASALSVSLASTSQNGADTSNSIAVAAGDYIDIEVTKASSVGTSPAAIVATLEYAPA